MPQPTSIASTRRLRPGSKAKLRSPMSQNSMPRRFWSGLRASSSVVAALKPAASTTPVRSRRVGVQLPVPCAIENTRSVAAIAPPNAAKSTNTLPRPVMIASNAATAAPPELPRM
jgi:hypothetical protein